MFKPKDVCSHIQGNGAFHFGDKRRELNRKNLVCFFVNMQSKQIIWQQICRRKY